jgi:hypothetical protein
MQPPDLPSLKFVPTRHQLLTQAATTMHSPSWAYVEEILSLRKMSGPSQVSSNVTDKGGGRQSIVVEDDESWVGWFIGVEREGQRPLHLVRCIRQSHSRDKGDQSEQELEL